MFYWNPAKTGGSKSMIHGSTESLLYRPVALFLALPAALQDALPAISLADAMPWGCHSGVLGVVLVSLNPRRCWDDAEQCKKCRSVVVSFCVTVCWSLYVSIPFPGLPGHRLPHFVYRVLHQDTRQGLRGAQQSALGAESLS